MSEDQDREGAQRQLYAASAAKSCEFSHCQAQLTQAQTVQVFEVPGRCQGLRPSRRHRSRRGREDCSTLQESTGQLMPWQLPDRWTFPEANGFVQSLSRSTSSDC